MTPTSSVQLSRFGAAARRAKASSSLLAALSLAAVTTLTASVSFGAPLFGAPVVGAQEALVQDGGGGRADRSGNSGRAPSSDSTSSSRPAAGARTDGREPLRYVLARSGGVTVRNLADVHGIALVDVPEGALLAVYGETAGWNEVDVPGGLPVWVFGRYLREVDGVAGVLEVTNNNVNMRPRAGSDVNNFPLGTRLVAGDQVAEITREDPSKPLAETWVQIWAPPGACGWVQAERTTPLVGEATGVELWGAAEMALATGAQPTGRGTAARPDQGLKAEPREASAPTAASLRFEAASAAVAAADALFAIERERAVPDFDGLRDAYRKALEPETEGAFESIVIQKLSTIDALEEIVRTRALLEEERAARRRENERVQREQWQRLRERDPFYGQFAVRGVLESFQDSRGQRTYRISRGGEAQTVVHCSSGRYDLELFVGREIGLEGGFVVVAEVDPATGAGASSEAAAFVAGLPALDLVALEVLR